MKNNILKNAFSLIELSIVILIIGILVAGVTQSSRLIKQFKLTTAKNITMSSPVSSIKDLVLWLETTQDSSFLTTQTDQNAQLTQWNDINPQVSTKNFMVKNASSQVVYESNGINGLPSVKFLGDLSQEYVGNNLGSFVLSKSPSLSDKIPMQTPYARLSVFLVTQTSVVSGGTRYAFYNGKANTATTGGTQDGWGYGYLFGPNRKYIHFGAVSQWPSNVYATNTGNEIVSILYPGIGSTTLQFYVNGVSESFPTVNFNPNPPTLHFVIGNANGYEMWNGLISEVIIFDRILNASERQDIEKYLGRKYAIKVS